MVIADVLKRWEVLKGERPALLCTGTDEHGMKVQQAAELQELHPKALCDTNSEIFRDLARKANIANDHFIRTTDPEHREAVEFFWRRLDEQGYIYETKHEGWYCVSDETFYPENMTTKAVCPRTGKTFMASTETGNAVEWTEEKNYHFRMTALRDRLLEFYKQNPEWVLPANRMREVVDWVENHLEDLSISRPSSRLQWGIPVPDDPSQTIYVWVDALINYITYAKYPYWAPGNSHVGGWPADVHVIGKDIVRFHCVYWPALLLALDLPLPKRILSHGHWLMDSKKMSKSIGNVVNPFFAMSRWGVDTMRYFLIYNAAIESDANYTNELLVEKYKKGLQGGLGNLVHRVTLAKKWSVREAIQAAHGHDLELPTENDMRKIEIATLINDHKSLLGYLVELVSEDLDSCAPKTALHRIMEFVFEVC
jgi:methionyl-tRNA synthetase